MGNLKGAAKARGNSSPQWTIAIKKRFSTFPFDKLRGRWKIFLDIYRIALMQEPGALGSVHGLSTTADAQLLIDGAEVVFDGKG